MVSAACRLARRQAWVCGGVGVVGEVRRERTAWGLAAVFGVGLVSGVFRVGGWALVPVFNLVMGVPLKVAVAYSEVAVAFGDAAAYLSAGFKLFCFDGGGAVLARVAALARVVRLVVLLLAAAAP